MSNLKNLALLVFLSLTCTNVLSPFCGLFENDELTEEELGKLGPLGRRLKDNFDEEIERIASERDMSKQDVIEFLRELAEMTEEETPEPRNPQQYREPKSRTFIRSLKWVFATFGVSVGLIWIFLYVKLHNNVDDDGQRIALSEQLRRFALRLTGAEQRITALEAASLGLVEDLEAIGRVEQYTISQGARYHLEAAVNKARRRLPRREQPGVLQRLFRRGRRRSDPGIFYTAGGHMHEEGGR